MTRNILLLCGILAMLWYVVMNILVPVQYPGYSIAAQTVSELSAIDAPTGKFWFSLGLLYSFLFIAFGFGVWLSANGNRKLRIVAAVILFDVVFGFFWPPMHRREIIAAGGVNNYTITATSAPIGNVLYKPGAAPAGRWTCP